MPYTTDPGPRIYFEMDEVPGGDPIVLIEGMGAQMIGWRQGFVDLLKNRGFSVVRLDNRDVGLSEKLGDWRLTSACYSIRDMADDVCRVLDALGLESAHIAGQSMGGIIAQAMAIHRPERVRSLTLFYTAPALDAAWLQPSLLSQLSSGAPRIPFPIPRWLLTRMAMPGLIDCGSDTYPADKAWLREMVGRYHERGFRLHGVARQVSMVAAGFDFRPMLGDLTMPCAIIHGHADHLIRIDAAFALATLLPDAALHIYPGLGHMIAEPLWPEFCSIIAGNASRAGRGAPL